MDEMEIGDWRTVGWKASPLSTSKQNRSHSSKDQLKTPEGTLMNEPCPVLTALITNWNSYLQDKDRERTTLPLQQNLNGRNTSAATQAQRRQTILHWHLRTALPEWLEIAGLLQEANTLREWEPIAAQRAHEISPLLTFLDTLNTSLTAKVNKLDDGNPPAVSHTLRFAGYEALGASGDRAALRASLNPYLPYPYWLITNRTETTSPNAAIAAVLLDHRAKPTDTVLHSASTMLKPTVMKIQESLLNMLNGLLQE